MCVYHRVMSPKDADRMANSVDPDQIYSLPRPIVENLKEQLYEPPHDKTNKMACVPSEHWIRVLAVRLMVN